MRRLATLAIAILLLVGAGAAAGADGDPYLQTCYSTGSLAPCTQLQPPFAARDAELSPDGRHLYVAIGNPGGGTNGVRLFDVAARGTITPRTGSAAITPSVPHDLDFSTDGTNVYVAAEDRLVVFQRDPNTGGLAQAQCFGPSPCSAVTGSNSFFSAAVSPDGSSVYVRGLRQLIVFDRAATGELTQKLGIAGCLTEETATSCTSAVGIAGNGLETVVSPDGRQVYVSNDDPGGVAVFNRDSTGVLGQLAGTGGGCVTVGGTSGSSGGTECTAGSPTLSQARAANLDPQGAFIIVSAVGGNTVFRRDAASGTLSQTDCLDEAGGGAAPAGCHEVKGAAGTDAALAPDGQHVVLNASEFGLSFFTFDRATGKLAQRASRGCFSAVAAPPCQHAAGLVGGGGGVAFSQTGTYVFAAFHGGSVASFERDFAPRCQKRTVTVRRRTGLAVPLTCTDANGDEVRFEIAAPPAFGTLGRVDQAKDRVLYVPPPRRKGKDTFRYRGNARGSIGPPATITLNIVAAPAKTDKTPPNTRITSGPPATTPSRTARFRFRSTERSSDFQCKPDWRKRWSSCRSPARYGNLRRGRHSFQVRAIDQAGNVDRTPAKKVWTVR